MVTATTREQLQRVTDTKGVLVLVTIAHASIQTARVVNDTRDWDIGGQTFVGLPFRFRLPQDAPGEAPRAQLEIDNVGRELTTELEKLPPGAALQCTIQLVSRATPTVVDFEFVSQLTNISASASIVTATVGNDDALRAPVVKWRYDPSTTPGLFEG